MSSAEKYRPEYTVDDYVNWEGDWELWGGTAIAMSSAPTPEHQAVSGEIYYRLRTALERSAQDCGHCRALYETDWQISNDTVVRLDVLVTCSPIDGKNLTQTPVLVAEVISPSTENKDRKAKFSLYESQQVNYCLIADPATKAIEMFSHDGSKFRSLHGDKHKLALSGNCEISVDLDVVNNGEL